MNLDSFIYEAIFEETPKHKVFYELVWEQFKEDGFVVVDEENTEIDCVFKAVAIQNLIGEFNYRMYDEINETGFEDVVDYLSKLGIDEEAIIDYCQNSEAIFNEYEDPESILKNGLDCITELVAEKLLENYSTDDLFSYLFTITYDFEQDFVYEFEDSEELLAFVDANSEKIANYKEEYSSLYDWIDMGMDC